MLPGQSPTQPSSPADPDFWLRALHEAFRPQWCRITIPGALLCLPAIAGWLFVGVLWGHQRWVMFCIAGAVTAAFGAFQKLAQSRIRPMAILLAGIALTIWIGNVAGHFGWYYVVVIATACGFAFGAITMLGYATWWIGLQWMIGLLVYGSHAFGPIPAAYNAVAVVVGGASQLIFLAVVSHFAAGCFPPQAQPPLNPTNSLLAAMRQDINPATLQGIYAVRVAAAMLVTTMIAHVWGLPNGYWMPMTAAILLRPDFYEATLRGLNRFAGTLIGAGLMTIVLAWLRPGPIAVGCLLLLAIFGCLSLLRVNYALFVSCVTAYVVLLFSLLGLPEPIVALHRVIATLIGAAVALAVSLFHAPGPGDPR